MELDEYLPTLRRANARFSDAAAEAVLAHGWTARVPGCPDWTLADLVWHLGEVQHFWTWIVRTRAADPSAYPEPTRRPDDELLGWGAVQSAELEAVLGGADPRDRVWTWAAQKNVAFVLRRQAQEATVHTVDVEQVLGDARPIPTAVALDGLDEWLEVMVPGALPDGPRMASSMVQLSALLKG